MTAGRRELLANATKRPWYTDHDEPHRVFGGDSIEMLRVEAEDAAVLVRAVNEYGTLLDIADAARAFLDGFLKHVPSCSEEAVPVVALLAALGRLGDSE